MDRLMAKRIGKRKSRCIEFVHTASGQLESGQLESRQIESGQAESWHKDSG